MAGAATADTAASATTLGGSPAIANKPNITIASLQIAGICVTVGLR